MDKIIRTITSDGGIMAIAVDASDIVFTAKKLHQLSPSAAAALGRLLCGASIMGDLLKQNGATMNLRMMGDGPLGTVMAVSDSRGNVRGYVDNPQCPTEYYENGKINVAKAVGKNGILNVIRDYGSGDPYIGQVPIVSGEIAEDIANYYATSEQIPTVCSLGVLLDKQDGEVLLAGGLLIQLLPGADEETISKLEKNAQSLEPMTTMLAKGMSVLDICKKALEGFDVEVLDENPVNYVCTCSKERVRHALESLSKEELKSIIEEDGKAEASCHFCNKKYEFNKAELQAILKNKK